MNDRSAYISLKKSFTRVRGGGHGNNAWIAKITGTDPQYTFARDFCEDDRSKLSNTGGSGSISFQMKGPGLYEFRNFCISSTSNWEWNGFVYIDDQGTVTELSKREVRKLLESQPESATDPEQK